MPTKIIQLASSASTQRAPITIAAKKNTSKAVKRITSAKMNMGSRSAPAISTEARMPKATKAAPWATV